MFRPQGKLEGVVRTMSRYEQGAELSLSLRIRQHMMLKTNN